MATRETITRRSRGTRLSSESKNNGTSAAIASTKSAEKQESSNADSSSKPAGRNGQLRRREKESKLEFSMRTLQRRWMLHIRQNPWVTGTILVGLLVALSFRTTKMTAQLPLVAMQLSTSFDIVFNVHATSSTELYEPEEFDSYDEDEASYSDYGDLKINFFEENGAVRTIIQDFSLSETDWRDNSLEPDDDVDA
jgi:hypothetical protein